MEDGKRRSIHQPMRDAIESIKALYELAAIEAHDDRAKEVIRKHNASQTSPWLRAATDSKRRPEPSAETPSSKRRQKTLSNDGSKAHPQKSSREGKKVPRNKADPQSDGKVSKDKPQGAGNVVKGKQPENDDKDTWARVVGKKNEPKKQKRSIKEKTRPDAIVVAAKGELSYADILRKVKAEPKLGNLGNTVTRIRRTQKGDLLFQLKGTGEKTQEFKGLIGETLGKEAEVRTLTHRILLEVKDIDEVTSKEDICEAVKTQYNLNGVSGTDVVNLRNAYGGTQTATISLPADSAKKLLESGRIKIGWVNCRIRERKPLTKCFKCLEFGHTARQCKSEFDRSKQCRRCGEEGHIAKDCTKDPLCILCKVDKPENARHVAGSTKCPVFKKALTSIRR